MSESNESIQYLPQELSDIQQDEINHFTVDIETLGLNPDAIVLSIGAVRWTLKGGIIGKFHEALHLGAQKGRTLTPETIQFWIDQPRNFGLDNTHRYLPSTSLQHLREFICLYWTSKKSTIWAQGPQFDITILEHMYKEQELPIPWEYNSVRDVRTLWKLFPYKSDVPNAHKHNALEDARTEALNTINILRSLQSALGDRTCVFK